MVLSSPTVASDGHPIRTGLPYASKVCKRCPVCVHTAVTIGRPTTSRLTPGCRYAPGEARRYQFVPRRAALIVRVVCG
jgi:hypothetical protein